MTKTRNILVVEDSPSDAFLLRLAVAQTHLEVVLHFVSDGEKAIEYLKQEGRHVDSKTAPLPDLILLDLKLPRMDGFDVLDWIRRQPGLNHLPVIVFTSSSLSIDINRAYALGAKSYLVKPRDLEQLSKVLKPLTEYWLELNQRPDELSVQADSTYLIAQTKAAASSMAQRTETLVTPHDTKTASVPRQPVFLLVEDNENDVALVRRAFSMAKLLNPLHVVDRGEKAVDYLSGTGVYSDRVQFPLPGLVLLDLRLPGLDGFAVLKWIRQEPRLNDVRIIVLTSSDDMGDVNLAYQLGANSFLVKPVDFETFFPVVHVLSGYWLWTDKTLDHSSPPDAQEAHPVLAVSQLSAR